MGIGVSILEQSHSVEGPTARNVDAHVHIHAGFEPEPVLDAAARNMRLASGTAGFLLLTEMAGVNAFAEVPGNVGSWKIEACSDGVTKRATNKAGICLCIVAGRQIVTSEGIEVLHHGTTEETPDGLDLEETLRRTAVTGTLTSLPWGFGKWTGSRGALIDKTISNVPRDGCYLADSGVRMAGTARPGQFSKGEAQGWRVLAGTDPLPLRKEIASVGRYGFIVDFAVDEEAPFSSLVTWLNSQTGSPEPYGRLQAPVGFVINQVAMQIRKRLG